MAPTIATLGTAQLGTTGTSFVSDVVTPTAGNIIRVTVSVSGNAASTAALTAGAIVASQGSWSWTLYQAAPNVNTTCAIFVFYADIPAGLVGTTTFTVTGAGTPTGWTIAVSEVAGSTNAAGVIQAGTVVNNAAGPWSITLSPAALTGQLVVQGWGSRNNHANADFATFGYTTLVDAFQPSGASASTHVGYAAGPQTTAQVGSLAVISNSGLALIFPAALAGTIPVPPARPGATWRRRFAHRIVQILPLAFASQTATGQGDARADTTGAALSAVQAAASATAIATGSGAATGTVPAASSASATATAAGTATVQSSTVGAANAIASGSGAVVVATPGASTAAATGTASGVGTPNTVATATAAAIASAAGVGTPRVVASTAATAIATGAGASTSTAVAAGSGTALATSTGASLISDPATGSGAALATAGGTGSAVPAGSVTGSASATGTAAGACTIQAISTGSGSATATSAGQCATRVGAAASASATGSSSGACFTRINSAAAASAYGSATALASARTLAASVAAALATAGGVASISGGGIVVVTPADRTYVIPAPVSRVLVIPANPRALIVPPEVRAEPELVDPDRVLTIPASDRTVTA